MAAGHKASLKRGSEEIELALMCEMFGALPDEVLRQDAFTIRRTYAILQEFKRIRKQRESRGGKK